MSIFTAWEQKFLMVCSSLQGTEAPHCPAHLELDGDHDDHDDDNDHDDGGGNNEYNDDIDAIYVP